ncbi:MAG: glycine cleavage system aminomethyltransferase GcvT [Actinobacteria bacterium]|nr:glycine cleavage system aminomethyltransferase GcvT [Actinomycetota bacterium]
MTQADATLKRSPLEAEHVALGAKMGPFAGWYMPIEYAGTLAEHRAVREAVGLFDLVHLGKVFVEGEGSLELLQHCFSNDIAKIDVGAAQYNLCLNQDGGIVDDVIVYRLGELRWLVVPNAANREKVHALMEASGVEVGVGALATIEDWMLIAPQGPRARELVVPLFPEAEPLEYMHCSEAQYHDVPAVVSRSGYTGEPGYELIVPEETAVPLWRELLERGEDLGVRPIGLAARDTLRLEMGYPLHGNDIDETTTPLQAAASWAVAMDTEFRGRDALLRQKEFGIPNRLWGLRMTGKLIPRAHYAVYGGDEPVGETTSGTFSPTLRIGIAMAYLAPRDRFKPGDTVEIDVRGRRGEAQVVKFPFVDSSPK